MRKSKSLKSPISLYDSIIEGIRRKKGLEIIDIEFTPDIQAECDHYIICHGTSSTHVDAVARSVEECTEELAGEGVYRVDGYQQANWILLDFVTIMVHIFQEPVRRIYDLESL